MFCAMPDNLDTRQKLRPGGMIKLRFIDEHTFGVYEVVIKARRGCIYVTEIYPRPDLKGQPCYSWPADLKLASLTQEAINTSMDAADNMLEVEISSDEGDEQPRYVIP